ncbi:MAG TPA: cytochrome P450, partial [Polyangiales bacterium]
RLWSDPLAFKPARWIEGEAEKLPRYAFVPFGGGNRICIGSHFALLEAGLLLATLMQHATLDVRPDFKLQLSPVVTLRSKNGLPVTVRRRPARTPTRESVRPDAAGCPHMAAKS